MTKKKPAPKPTEATETVASADAIETSPSMTLDGGNDTLDFDYEGWRKERIAAAKAKIADPMAAVVAEADREIAMFRSDLSFFVPTDSPVAPAPGMVAQMFGEGFGRPVRGLLLDGQCVFYRTAEEQAEHEEIERFGRDPADLLGRWDAGKTVYTVEMGGLGPGYEQAIQITVFEVLRHLLSAAPDASRWKTDPDAWTADREAIETAVFPVVDPLGLSGAQWGAAASLAAVIYRDGPRKTFRGVDGKRLTRVSRVFPSLEPRPAGVEQQP